MPIHRTSIESSISMATTNELTNGNKIQTSDVNLSMEYETPPIDSLPMDDDDDEDDEEEYESDGEEQEIAYNPACRICGLSSYTHQCQGKCRYYFHRECVSIFDEQQTLICPECSANHLICALCQQLITDNELKCGFNQCNRIYHSSCLVNSNLTTTLPSSVYYCPLHICATCHLHKRPNDNIGHLFTCLYCPTAYHGHERCLPAGSLSITYSSSLCCPIHLPNERKPVRSGIAPYCYICEQSTRSTECFVCIECPTTIHQSCLISKNDEKPTSWKCDDCLNNLKPLYGDICWIKMGKFRCWPSRILHERHAPDNLLAQERTVGEFLIHFFGSKEFFWANKHHYLSFENRCIKSKDSRDFSTAEQSFKDGLREAKRLYNRLKQFYATNSVENYGEATKLEEMTLDDAYDELEDDDDDDETDDESVDMNSDESITNDQEKISTVNGRSKLIDKSANKNGQMPAYRHIKTLKPIGEAQILRSPLAELSRCDCDPNKPDPCSSDEHCLNRMLKYECHPHVCAAGDKCKNQRFQKRNYPAQQVFWTAGRGWGLRTLVPIKEGEFVNEYVGELITYEETERRVKLARKNNVKDFYFLVLDKDRVIDAGPRGNLSRFANHSCDPNLRTEKWNITGDLRVGLFAIRDIEAGEELTFEYGVESEFRGDTIFHCLCGAETCTGFMGRSKRLGGVPSLTDTTLSLTSGSNGVSNGRYSNKQRIRTSNITGEQDVDTCFGCGLTGQLIACQMSKCSRKFHPKCIKVKGQSFRNRSPTQRWICPSHRCDICGIDANIACADCLSSFCDEHRTENMRGIYCLLHGHE
ncbi:unnamed protein product [Rotaria sp. Silwood1]|nr:unnamed protein product [Rotaria sp. Silwood1]CAF0833810.1 unnamed protein product [Rotaria sp. Silwood1]CAF3366266.1 unnamed protein product [Rotaria sp. Silwood1]CAF4669023.1 unnamed protein product [Rotaria sp. Silwood1]